MVTRETVKREIDNLNESQLSRIAEHIYSLKAQAQKAIKTKPFWDNATPKERAQDFLEWVSGLNRTGSTLPDGAFDRSSIYE
jgi:transposase